MSHLRPVSCKRHAESINLLRGRTGSSLCLKDVGETCLWSLMLFKSITGVHQLRSFISSPISHILKAFLVPGPASNAGITKPRKTKFVLPRGGIKPHVLYVKILLFYMLEIIPREFT